MAYSCRASGTESSGSISPRLRPTNVLGPCYTVGGADRGGIRSIPCVRADQAKRCPLRPENENCVSIMGMKASAERAWPSSPSPALRPTRRALNTRCVGSLGIVGQYRLCDTDATDQRGSTSDGLQRICSPAR